MKNICIIGAGAAGLVALRRFNSSSEGFFTTVFEQTGEIGGIWCYTEKTGENVHSAMYRDLRINIPREVMKYMDFPFDKPKDSYGKHEQVLEYLNDYANHFKLWDQIQFHTRVEKVKPIYGDTEVNGEDSDRIPIKWHVTVRHLRNGETSRTLEFDHVIICNGHFAVPFYPKIENLDQFQGKIIHSKDYRFPEMFADKKVVTVGRGPSGIDISLEIAAVAKKVIMSIRNPPTVSFLHSNIEQVPPIKSVFQDGFIFENGMEVHDCDFLVLCSGYQYSYPFLDEDCGISVKADGQWVTPLYKQCLHPQTHLCFLGLPFHCIPFYMSEIQIRWFIHFLEGQEEFPSVKQMTEGIEEEMKMRREIGLSPKQSHQLGPLQWDYYYDLAQAAGFEAELKPVIKVIMETVTKRRLEHASIFKNDQITVFDDENCEIKCAEYPK